MNCLDQFIKHNLKYKYYQRYVDDLILLHNDMKKLITWKKEIYSFIQENLKLELHPKRQKLQLVKNGIDFVGYIVRPNYILARKRVVNNLKSKLAYYEKKLKVSTSTAIVFKFDYGLLDDLFKVFNSYLAHFKHGNCFKLVTTLFRKFDYLNEYFAYDNSKLKRKYVTNKKFVNIKHQYYCLSRHFKTSLVFFQVGKFYELYNSHAFYASRLFRLKILKGKYGFYRLCRFPIYCENKYLDKAVNKNTGVIVVKQTQNLTGHLIERAIEYRAVPLSARSNS